jgi:hypothetical protein
MYLTSKRRQRRLWWRADRERKAMSPWRAGHWLDIRRQAALVMWWAGQALCGVCCLAALVVLYVNRFDTAGQVCAAALLLLGMFALIGGRWLLVIGSRRTRRRLDVY